MTRPSWPRNGTRRKRARRSFLPTTIRTSWRAAAPAFEILEVVPDVDTLVVPIGGGGLISGIAIAAKAVVPSIRVVGVEADASSAISASLRNGRITVIEPQPTIADGLGGNVDPETITFPIIQRHVD